MAVIHKPRDQAKVKAPLGWALSRTVTDLLASHAQTQADRFTQLTAGLPPRVRTSPNPPPVQTCDAPAAGVPDAAKEPANGR